MEYSIDSISMKDREEVMKIFNHYVENSFAAYPETKLPVGAFDSYLKLLGELPVISIKNGEGMVVGFGLLRWHNGQSTFSHTAEATYFIHHQYIGKGLGKKILKHLEKEAVVKGIINILVHISSLNHNSIGFHEKNGFVECGRFVGVGVKKGVTFDTIWMQKIIGKEI